MRTFKLSKVYSWWRDELRQRMYVQEMLRRSIRQGAIGRWRDWYLSQSSFYPMLANGNKRRNEPKCSRQSCKEMEQERFRDDGITQSLSPINYWLNCNHCSLNCTINCQFTINTLLLLSLKRAVAISTIMVGWFEGVWRRGRKGSQTMYETMSMVQKISLITAYLGEYSARHCKCTANAVSNQENANAQSTQAPSIVSNNVESWHS